MGASRPMTPVPAAVLPGLRVTRYASATAYPIGMSRDRKTLYGCPNPAAGGSAALYQSTDDAATWTLLHTFPEAVLGILETDDGEALVATVNVATTPGYVYKSTGWAASHATATWAVVLTTLGGFVSPIWGLHNATFGNDSIAPGTSKLGITNEYGAQTSGVADPTKAIHAYVTTDYGATWRQVLDLQARYGAALQPMHIHASAYDPWWDRMWVTYGDVAADGPNNSQVLFSDDHGVTWNVFGLTSEWASLFSFQSTAILPVESAVIMLSDNQPGIVVIPRDGYRATGGVQVQCVLFGGNTSGLIGEALHRTRNAPDTPILATFQNNSSRFPAAIYASLDGGKTFLEVWRDTGLTGNSGVLRIFGPTYSGKVAAFVNNLANGTRYGLVAELVVPGPGLYDGLVTFIGDGATTAFTVAHGLSAKPNQVIWWPTSLAAAGAAVAVTSDGANLTFTFSVAPANTAILDFAYRVG